MDSAGAPDISRPPLGRRDWLAVAAFLPLALAYTWPLAAVFGSELAGNQGDSWQNLWNFGWLARSAGRGESPLFTPDLWHPDGVTLAFQTFDWPDAVWAAPLLRAVGPLAAYNVVIVWVFVASGAAMYALGRSTGASRPAAFLSGCAYTFSTYHFGHSLGHLHILAMQWVPLFVLALLRMFETGRWRWALVGGVTLALASLASWYYLVGCFLLAVPIAIWWTFRNGLRAAARAVPRALVLCATYLALVGPLGVRMLEERAKEPIAGSHRADWFSADLESFAFPNGAQALKAVSPRHFSWTGNAAENTTYLGWAFVAIALAGLFFRAKHVGVYLAAAVLGVALSLGPALHVGGRVVTGDVLPYVWAERAFPLLSFMGVPVRFAFAATFGLAAALAPALDAIAARFSWKAALPLVALGLAEHLPNRFVTSSFPVPAPMREWAENPADFAVLDATRDLRHLWHQTIHGHPIMGGYMTRTPERLERKLAADPVAGPLWAWEPPLRTGPVRFDTIDLDHARAPMIAGAESTRFSLELAGELHVPADGEYRFTLSSDDGSELSIDGARVVDNGGEHALGDASGSVALTKGLHSVTIRYDQQQGGAVLRASWSGAGFDRMLGPADVPSGFSGTARFRRRELRLDRDAALAHLRTLKIRYVVQPSGDSSWPMEGQLGLRPIHDADGVRIYEIP